MNFRWDWRELATDQSRAHIFYLNLSIIHLSLSRSARCHVQVIQRSDYISNLMILISYVVATTSLRESTIIVKGYHILFLSVQTNPKIIVQVASQMAVKLTSNSQCRNSE